MDGDSLTLSYNPSPNVLFQLDYTISLLCPSRKTPTQTALQCDSRQACFEISLNLRGVTPRKMGIKQYSTVGALLC